ncbi:MAG: pyridoxamine 5'-phosphate oxidase family protein [Candidatus Eremiobacteraeota bacterium]|nr:pyridoxamine 5'-phosphate oxidase family protein [Candidatus Eremiobacteraeota bacterium]
MEQSEKGPGEKTGAKAGAKSGAMAGEKAGKKPGVKATKKAGIEDRLRDLFSKQKLAVLSTSEEGHPFTNLVGFTASGDLRHIFFSTNRATRKYENISKDPRVSLLIDSRANRESDFHRAMAVTIMGTAAEIPYDKRPVAEEAMISRLPHLRDFVLSPTTAVIEVTVHSYCVVTEFQNVHIIEMPQ